MYDCFSLVLMVTHACNLRCTYCYTGTKLSRSMNPEVGRAAVERALRSIRPAGTFELGFFGGEPLLEADLILDLIEYATAAAAEAGVGLHLSMTTNGTLATGRAWQVMTLPAMQLAVSHDGLPEVHDRHRRGRGGGGTSAAVLATIRRLQEAGKTVRVNMVVRPDNVGSLPEGIARLRELGIRQIDTSLDVWTHWNRDDARQLEQSLVRCAELWRAGLPHCGISWFDEKAAKLAGVPTSATARCGFGDGEIAVAPSGNLYPCERLIGEDAADNPMRLPGHALEGDDFCLPAVPGRSAEGCAACAIQTHCNTTCRCSNYVRTGDVTRPDGLLCLLDRVIYRETSRVLRKLQTACTVSLSPSL